MVFPILLNKKFKNVKEKFINKVESLGLETRPIISGNFLKQPAAKLYKLKKKNEYFKNADEIDKRGFFIGLHTKTIDQKTVNFLTNKFLNIKNI